MFGKFVTIALLAAVWFALAGCADTAAGPSGPYRTIAVEPGRDTDAASRQNQKGLAHLAAGELDQACDAFGRALNADVEFGPAHNNLGKVYFQRKNWYKAAWEFEYARKLMPRRAEPANNLGLVLEQAGELDRAVEHYRQAVALDSGKIEYVANLARALVRRGERTDETRRLLQRLLAEDQRPDWLIWARQQLAGMPEDPF